MMRWIGFDLDQIGREHMVARITGQRNKGQMALDSTPEGTVPSNGVLWVDPTHPRWHKLSVTWSMPRCRSTAGHRSRSGPTGTWTTFRRWT